MRRSLIGLALAVAVATVGCEKQGANAPTVDEYQQKRTALVQGATPAGPKRRGAQAAAADPSGAAMPAVAEYRYDPTGKRDPFRSFVLEHRKELASHERGPLEQFDLNQLAVVAVVWDSERPRALVEDPSGRGYIVQDGTAIGKNDGHVVRIDDNLVTVREAYVDYLGARTEKDVEMRVRSTQGG